MAANRQIMEQTSLPKFRMNSPSIQALILCIAVFLVPGMNGLVVGLGAGGSHPSNIEVVDKINIVSTVFMTFGGIIGGNINNQIGPRYTLMIGTSGYPIYLGSLWFLDQGRSPMFAYFAAVYKGFGGGLVYTAVGYIATSYAQEENRGIYIGAISASIGLGSVVGSGIILGLTTNGGVKASHVPSTVYAVIITLESVGFLVASLLQSPNKIIRKNGQTMVVLPSKTWRQELMSLPKSIMTPSVLLTSIALFSCQMIFSLTGSLNAFYFNARTRALVNLTFWLSTGTASLVFGFFFDSKWLGNRRRRSMIISAIVTTLVVGSHSGLVSFLATHNVDRHKKPLGTDWNDSTQFTHLLVIYIFVGLSSYVFQNYLLWLLATFTSDPTVLSLFSGYVEALKALGILTAFAIDSRHTAFLTEEISYFSLKVLGLVLCFASSKLYTQDTHLGDGGSVTVSTCSQSHMRPASDSIDSEDTKVVTQVTQEVRLP